MIAPLLCLAHLLAATASPTDYSLAQCQPQRVSTVIVDGRPNTAPSNLDHQKCGRKVVVEYESISQLQLLEFSLFSRGRKCNETFRLSLGKTSRAQVVVVGEQGCQAAVEHRGGPLAITPLGEGVCCNNISVLSCTSAPSYQQKEAVRIFRRGLPQHNSQLHHHSVVGSDQLLHLETCTWYSHPVMAILRKGMRVTLAGMLGVSLLLLTTIASVTTFVSCCRSKPDHSPDVEKPPMNVGPLDSGSTGSSTISSSGDQYKQYLMERPYYPCPSSSCSPSSTTSPCHPIGSCNTNMSFVSSMGMDAARQYLANRQLPDVTEAVTEENPSESRGNSDAQHIYFTLDGCRVAASKEQDEEEETNLDTGGSSEQQPRSRRYFVLEVSEDGPTARGSTDDVRSTNRFYHMLEPLHEETQPCSMCQQCIERKQDSLYLVILPDDFLHNTAAPPPPSSPSFPPPSSPPSSSAAAATMSGEDSKVVERKEGEEGAEKGRELETRQEGTEIDRKSRSMYYTLEQPPAVICMQCMYSLDDDPIYNEVDDTSSVPDPIYEKIRQDTVVSQSSDHTYCAVPSFDHEHTLPGRTAPAEMDSQSEASSQEAETNEDYASIPSSPIYSQPLTRTSVDLNQVVSSLRKKMFKQLHQTQRCQPSSPPPPDPSAPTFPSPLPVSSPSASEQLVSSVPVEEKAASSWDFNPTDSRALLVAQRKRTGSYVLLNVDSIWKHQQRNHYAPVSIMKPRRSSSKGKNPMRDLHQRMLDHHQHQLREQQLTQEAADYEVPISCMLQSKVPPPRLLRNFHRQSAVDSSMSLGQSGGDWQSFRPAHSEPCLNLSGMENLREEDEALLSPIKSPIFKSQSVKLHGNDDRKDPSLTLPLSPCKSPQKRLTYPFL